MKFINVKKLIITICILMFSVPAFSETIKLKSGKTFEGRILEYTDEYIKVNTDLGISITHFLDEVESIDGRVLNISEEIRRDTSLEKKKEKGNKYKITGSKSGEYYEMEGEYVEVEGGYQMFYPDGVLMEESLENGGISREYYPNGKLKKEEITTREGEVDRRYNENGIIESESFMDASGNTELKMYDSEGNLEHASKSSFEGGQNVSSMIINSALGELESDINLNLDGDGTINMEYYDENGQKQAVSIDLSDNGGMANMEYIDENGVKQTLSTEMPGMGFSDKVADSMARVSAKTTIFMLESYARDAENFAKENGGAYPNNIEMLADYSWERTQELFLNYCGKSQSHFKYTCDLSKTGYVFRAEPTTNTNEFLTTLEISTGETWSGESLNNPVLKDELERK